MPSETDTSAKERRELPDSIVRAQLERILASEVFSRSLQLRRFLSFIVEQRLAGQGHSLKESVLAHELYGKGTDFDGGADPVVRVDARRLRDKLREYYEGRSDPVVISLPKGSYAPVFEANSASPTHAAPPVVPSEPQQTVLRSRSRRFSPELQSQSRQDCRQRSGRRRCGHRRRALLAHTQYGERASPTAPPRFVPRCGGAAGVVPGRQPRRLRVVGRRRPWTDRYLCESRRE